VFPAFRRWRSERIERRRRRYLTRHGDVGRAEVRDLLDQQSPVKGKWGFFPK
jgi:hypothetical protein